MPIDIIAGITLAALAIPEVMGYTKIAGMPVITGLYTILMPITVFALLGSSRHLVVGADSATAAIMFAALAGLAAPESTQWVALAGWLAILAAGFLVLARMLKLGFLADFFSRTVLIGFLTGVGIQVACGQIAGMLGVPKTGRGPLLQAYNAIKASLGERMARRRIGFGADRHRRFEVYQQEDPRRLDRGHRCHRGERVLRSCRLGVSTLGTMPSGLPHFGVPALPPSAAWSTLIGTAASLFLVILAQSAATSRAYASSTTRPSARTSTSWDSACRTCSAALSGTFVVNGSPTKTRWWTAPAARARCRR